MANLISFSDFFNGESLFRIPNYQRGFAWQEDQINDFWKDLINLREDVPSHYTGMITLQSLGKKDWKTWEDDEWYLSRKGTKAFHVIDGQQRLTTFVILINSMITYAENKGYSHIGSIALDTLKRKYLYKTNGDDLISFVFGYEVDNPSFDYLKYKIYGVKAPKQVIAESYYTNNLGFAKDFFDKNIEAICKGNQFVLDDLFLRLTTKMKFLKHIIDNNLNVFVAFETMNNRGKRLSTLELLKNRLVYLSTIFPNNVADSFTKEHIKRKINESWCEVYSNLGRNKDSPLDDDEFLRSHWILYFGYSRNEGSEFIKYLLNKQFTVDAVLGKSSSIMPHTQGTPVVTDEGYLSSVPSSEEGTDKQKRLTPKMIIDYVYSLSIASKQWFFSFNPRHPDCKYTPDEISAIERLNRIGIAYFRPLVIASFINESVKSKQRIRLFECIERTILLIFRMARNMSTYQSTVYYRYANELYSNNIIENIIHDLNELFISNLESGIDSFKDKMLADYKNEDGFYRWNSIRFLLYEYEAHLCSKNHAPLVEWSSFVEFNRDMVSIEHIYPQNPKDSEWPDFALFDKETKKRYLNSLGNLLLLKNPINSGLQNNSFEAKKQGVGGTRGYSKGSDSEKEVALYNKWGPDEIKERGLTILSFMESRWKIVFRNREQKLQILGIDYDGVESDEKDYQTRFDELKLELLGENPEQRVPSGLKEVPLFDVTSTGQTVQGIKYGDRFYRGKTIHCVLNVLADIISSDPSILESNCGIIEGKARTPRYVLSDPPTSNYREVCGFYIHMHTGSYALDVLKHVIKLYNLVPESFVMCFSKK